MEFAPTFDEINKNAEAAVKAHEKAFGYPPSPGLLLNVLKAPIQPADYPALFDGASTSRRSRRAQTANTSVLGPNYKASRAPLDLQSPTIPGPTVESVTGTVTDTLAATRSFWGGSASTGTQAEDLARSLVTGELSWGDLYEATKDTPGLYADVMQAASEMGQGTETPLSGPAGGVAEFALPSPGLPLRDPEKEAELVAEALRQNGIRDVNRDDLKEIGAYMSEGALHRLEQGGDFLAGAVLGEDRNNAFARATYQVGQMLIGMPFGTYELGKSFGLDLRDLTTEAMRRFFDPIDKALLGEDSGIPERPLTFDRSREMLSVMWQGYKDDFEHPWENIGFFVVDVFGLATLAANTAAKAGQAGRVIQGVDRGTLATAGVEDLTSLERYGRAARTMARRYRPEPFEFGVQGATDFKFLSQNAITALVQREFYRVAQRGLENPDFRLLSTPEAINGLFGRWLGSKAIQRRGRVSSIRLQSEIELALAKEFERMVTARGRANSVFREAIHRRSVRALWGAIDEDTKIALDRAILIKSMDAPDDATAVRWMRENHERAVTALNKKIDSREEKLLREANVLTDEAKARIERQIREYRYLVERSNAQIDALTLGHATLSSPRGPSALGEMLDFAQEVSMRTEENRKLFLGLDEARANQHMIDIRMAWTGELPELNRLVGKNGTKGKIRTLEGKIAKRKAREASIIAAGGDPRIARPGEKVVAPDRGNLGTVKKIEDGVATVRFVNPETKAVQTVEFPLTDLTPARKPIEEMEARLDSMKQRAEFLTQQRKTRVNPERSFYITYLNDLLTTPKKGWVPGRLAGRFGLPAPQELSTIKHQFDGDTIIWGTYAYDTSRLIHEQAKMTVKSIALAYEHDQLIALAKKRKNPYSPDGLARPVAIRPDRDGIDPELRRQVAWLDNEKQGILTSKEVEHLDENGLAGLRKDIVRRRSEIDGNESDWLWVDESQLNTGAWTAGGEDFLRGVDKALALAMTVPNEVGRIAYLFGRLAYGLNYLGAASLEMIHQGPWHVRNFATAVRAEDIWGRKTRALLDDLGDSGRTVSFLTEKNPLTKVSQKLADIWQPLTDQFNRRSSIIYELRREVGADGQPLLSVAYDDAEQFARLTDPANRKAVGRARAYSRRHSVNFSNLSPLEQATFRHLFFIYAWASRSAVWSLHFLDTHPALASVLSQAGKNREQVWEDLLGDVAAIDYLFEHGYIPVADDAVVDPIQVGTPASIVQEATGWWNTLSGGDLDTVRDQLGPGASFFLDLGAGPENPYDEKGLVPAAKRFVTDTPQAKALGVGQPPEVTAEDLPPINPVGGYANAASRAMAPLTPALKMRVLKKNDFLIGDMAPLVFGSASVRNTDELAAQARIWRDWQKNDPERIVNLITERLNLLIDEQEKLVGREAPLSVRDSVRLNALIELRSMQEDAKRPDGERKSVIDTVRVILDVLREDEQITQEEHDDLWGQALEFSRKPTPELDQFKSALLMTHGGAPFMEWNDLASQVFRDAAAVGTVAAQPGVAANDVDRASVEDRRQWAREFADYQDSGKAVGLIENSDDRSHASLLLKEQGSKPVIVNGLRFPSFEEYRWERLSDDAQRQYRLALTKQEWDGLTSFEKKLVTGDDTKATDFTKAWVEYDTTVRDARSQVETRTARGESGYRIDPAPLARELDKTYRGFQEEWAYANTPRYQRFADTVVYKQSDYKGEWDSLFLGNAEKIEGFVNVIREDPASYDQTVSQYTAAWNVYVGEQFAEMEADPKYAGMVQEIKDLGGESFLKGLIRG